MRKVIFAVVLALNERSLSFEPLFQEKGFFDVDPYSLAEKWSFLVVYKYKFNIIIPLYYE